MSQEIIPIGMDEMNRIFDVVDELEISREAIQVELLPAGDGTVERLAGGKVRIVVPESTALSEWLPTLAGALRDLDTAPAGDQA